MTSLSPANIGKSLAMTPIKNYRPDIDGLRAIAVISVILYHFKIGLFSGGFVGVDIFFVISGYLITKGVIEKQHLGRFEFSDFYFRRVRRLIPALLATIAASYIAAFLFFSPADFKQMSGATVYALTGLSNIFFWMESGYFDTDSIVKPLLHTWSLSVEIQFYILWPILLILITKLTNKLIIPTLALLLIGGYYAVTYLSTDASGAFYLTPFRFHEFLFGGIILFSERLQVKKWFYDLAYIIGLALITYSIFFFNSKTTIFPGYAAMVPVAGAALMIFGGANSAIARPFSSKIATKIGEISYSLYLVHWPILVFTTYVVIDEISPFGTTGLVALTFISAMILYATIEKPFRSAAKSKLNGPEFSLAILGCSVVIIIISANSWAKDGWNWRMPQELLNITKINQTELDKYVWDRELQLDLREGFDLTSTKEKILVIGDSQAADIVNVLAEDGYTSNSDIVSRIVFTNCSTFYIDRSDEDKFFTKVNTLTIQRPDLIAPCKERMARAIDSQLLNSADKIYIAFHWNTETLDYNLKAIEKITSMTKAKVFVFGQKSLSKSSIDIAIAMRPSTEITHFASRFKSKETMAINTKLSSAKNINFVDMMQLTCPSEISCVVLTPENKPIFFDPGHLTKEGAKYLGKSLVALIESSKPNI
jgi:peptidoglycan/LPS O-acetylase OafA/YrhL/phosphotransferase system HPr-like phosphotransfer protein